LGSDDEYNCKTVEVMILTYPIGTLGLVATFLVFLAVIDWD
jgi:hypothetical protein